VRPEGIVTATIDPESGLLAYEGQENAIEEEFLEGTVPTERAVPPDAADPNTFLMEQTGETGGDDGASAEVGEREAE
jgi:penicillin-binding protein 1A